MVLIMEEAEIRACLTNDGTQVLSIRFSNQTNIISASSSQRVLAVAYSPTGQRKFSIVYIWAKLLMNLKKFKHPETQYLHCDRENSVTFTQFCICIKIL